MNIEIRKADIKDLNELCQVEKQCLKESYNLCLKCNEDYFRKGMEWFTYIVATIDNRIVGFTSYNKNNNRINPGYEEYAEISNLYVLKQYQNKGIGKLLFKETILNLKNLSYEKFYVDCKINQEFFIKYGGKNLGEHSYLCIKSGCDIIVFDINKTLELIK